MQRRLGRVTGAGAGDDHHVDSLWKLGLALTEELAEVAPNPVPSTSQGLATFTVGAAPAAGGAPIRSVRVTLGDGTVIYQGTGGGTFAYRFGGSGTYIAMATVTDAAGAVGTTTTAILVQ